MATRPTREPGVDMQRSNIGINAALLCFVLLACSGGKVSAAEPQAAPPELTDRFGIAQGLPAAWARALAVDASGNPAVSVESHPGSQAIVRIRGGMVQPLEALAGAEIHALAFDRSDRLWAGTATGLYRLDGKAWSRQVDGGPVSGIAADGDGLWSWGAGGVFRVADGVATPVTVDPPCPRPLVVVPGTTTWLVCRTGIRVGTRDGLVERSLTGTGLVGASGAPDDGSAPPIWLTAATSGPGGALLVTGRTERMVLLTQETAQTAAAGRFTRLVSNGAAVVAIADDGGVQRWSAEGGAETLWTEPGTIGPALIDGIGNLFVVRQPRAAAHSVERRPHPWTEADRVWSLAIDDSLSPGVSAMASDQQGGVWLSTNRGAWHLH